MSKTDVLVKKFFYKKWRSFCSRVTGFCFLALKQLLFIFNTHGEMTEDRITFEQNRLKRQFLRKIKQTHLSNPTQIKVKQKSPHPRLIYSLFKCLELERHDQIDKSTWQYHIQYKEKKYLIGDHKHSSWWIGSEPNADDSNTHDLANLLISMAKKYEEKILSPRWKNDLENDRYSINNSFLKMWNTYQFFKGKTEGNLSRTPEARADDLHSKLFTTVQRVNVTLRRCLPAIRNYRYSRRPAEKNINKTTNLSIPPIYCSE